MNKPLPPPPQAFAYLAIMNFRWTLQTIIDKRSYASKMIRGNKLKSMSKGNLPSPASASKLQ